MPQVEIRLKGDKATVEQALTKLRIHHNLQDLKLIAESRILQGRKGDCLCYLMVEFEAASNA
jgi:hypothetical protein